MSFILYNENCLNAMKRLEDNSVDSIVTDPPYGLSFMGKKWDYDVPSQEIWAECLRVLKPGGHLLAFAGTRTQHRMAVRIEDAGFEIRDMIAWVYGSGFPKSHDVSKAIDKQAGAEREVIGPRVYADGTQGHYASQHEGYQRPSSIRKTENNEAKMNTAPATEAAKQWEGWGTALKPALEPITVARKPLIGTVAENVLEHGTGGLNIDGCRVDGAPPSVPQPVFNSPTGRIYGMKTGEGRNGQMSQAIGRWPANLIHDGSDEVVGLFPETKTNAGNGCYEDFQAKNCYGNGWTRTVDQKADKGSAARFFYCAKASKKDRDEGLEGFENQTSRNYRTGNVHNGHGGRVDDKVAKNVHPTVKPTDLMRYLCRLITPPNGVILDPFMGSGSTGKAAMLEGFQFIGCELSPEYMEIAKARIEAARVQGAEKPQQSDNLELF
jgi:site-specific DNA-methyltransferase (adenine-specific)